VTAPPLRDQIAERAALADIRPTTEQLDKLVQYFLLLERWNQKINLTALPLAARENSTIDRLIVEPLIAASGLASHTREWFDFGSGGGSPAIPMKLMHPSAHLVMVEAKERKAAFLREAVSSLGIFAAEVLTVRIEELPAPQSADLADLVTMRAVRPDPEVLAAAHTLLKMHGLFVLFRGRDDLSWGETELGGEFNVLDSRSLAPSSGILLTLSKSR